MNISPAVADALSAAQIEGNRLYLTGQLDRKVYQETNQVLETIGGKWSRKDKAHIFPSSPQAAIDAALKGGSIETDRDRNYFPTPEEIVEWMLTIADIDRHHRVLEPSAGEGAIAAKAKEMTEHVDVVEIHAGSRAKLASQGFNVIGEDFLQLKPTPEYDCIMMNPPFSKGIEIDHVMHALEFMKPTGRLVAVLPNSFKYRTGKKWKRLREIHEASGGECHELPPETFKDAGPGTKINTVLISINGIA